MSFPSSDGKSIMYSYNLMFLYMILQAGMFSAISFTRNNSKTMMVALLARLPEETVPSLQAFLVGYSEDKRTRQNIECSSEKRSQNDNNVYICIHFPLH